MCRIFAFRSILQSKVHSSLVSAENALGKQGINHPDGWGVAFYNENIPHIIKSSKSAFDNQIFKKVSGVVSSQTVLAHIRKATKGNINILNTHPFQYGKWSFIHNGNINNFNKHRKKLVKLIDSKYLPFILGDTDSEVIFFIILSYLNFNYHDEIKNALIDITNIIGPLEYSSKGSDGNYITFVMTNGTDFIGFQGGKKLYYSTYKKLCAERDICPEFSESCEKEAVNGQKIKHLLFSSSPINFYKDDLQFNNSWKSIKDSEIISIDQEFILKKSTIII